MAQQEQSLGVLKALALSERLTEANRRAVFGTGSGSSKHDKGDGEASTLAFLRHTLQHCLKQDPPPAGFLTHSVPAPAPAAGAGQRRHSLRPLVFPFSWPSSPSIQKVHHPRSRAPPPLFRTIRHRRGILIFPPRHMGPSRGFAVAASPFHSHADGEAPGWAGMAEQALATLRLLCRDAAEAQLIGAPSPRSACTLLRERCASLVAATQLQCRQQASCGSPLCHHPPPGQLQHLPPRAGPGDAMVTSPRHNVIPLSANHTQGLRLLMDVLVSFARAPAAKAAGDTGKSIEAVLKQGLVLLST